MGLTQTGQVSDLSLGAAIPVVPAPPDNGAGTTVSDGWLRSQEYADRAFNAAQTYLNNLQYAATGFSVPAIDPHLLTLNLDISQFDSLLATAPVAPGNNFDFAEIPYSANLLTDLRARLLEWVDGTSTGILPSVEQAIYDRGRSRQVVATNRKSQEAVRSFAMRGFPKPPGALSTELQEAAQEAQNADVSLNRDIIIKQAELEQSNRRFSFEQAWKVEEGAIAYMNNQMQRALDKAKTLQQFYIEIFQQAVNEYDVASKVYSARVGAETSVFNAKVNEQVAEANVRIEAAKANIQLLIQEVSLFMEAVKAGAQVSSQLAASALSSLNISAQVSDRTQTSSNTSASLQASNSESISFGASANYNYSGTAGAG